MSAVAEHAFDWDLANPLLRRPDGGNPTGPSPVDRSRPLPVGPARRPDGDLEAVRLWGAAAAVHDPEIPVLSLADLGVLRDAYVRDGRAVVVITPTYSGCPAMATMAHDIRNAAREGGWPDVWVEEVLQPAWTTDWMTPEGRAKLDEYGIAPPSGRARAAGSGPIALALAVKCPHCDSLDTRETTRYGSTSCKALWTCNRCLEPFDYFKVH